MKVWAVICNGKETTVAASTIALAIAAFQTRETATESEPYTIDKVELITTIDIWEENARK